MHLHVSMTVTDLNRSIAFYSKLFKSAPTLAKEDYAQWILEDPKVNFSIETRGGRPGVTHLGVSAANESELADLYARAGETGGDTYEEGDTVCCYAKSTKTWLADPENVRWEFFLTHERTDTFGREASVAGAEPETAVAGCCT